MQDATLKFKERESLKISEQNAVKEQLFFVAADGWTAVEARRHLRQDNATNADWGQKMAVISLQEVLSSEGGRILLVKRGAGKKGEHT